MLKEDKFPILRALLCELLFAVKLINDSISGKCKSPLFQTWLLIVFRFRQVFLRWLFPDTSRWLMSQEKIHRDFMLTDPHYRLVIQKIFYDKADKEDEIQKNRKVEIVELTKIVSKIDKKYNMEKVRKYPWVFWSYCREGQDAIKKMLAKLEIEKLEKKIRENGVNGLIRKYDEEIAQRQKWVENDTELLNDKEQTKWLSDDTVRFVKMEIATFQQEITELKYEKKRILQFIKARQLDKLPHQPEIATRTYSLTSAAASDNNSSAVKL